jgi:hypothetical protein
VRSEDRARWLLVGAVAVTIALYVLPYGRYIAYPLLLLSTYAHEMGHGVTAMLVGGSLESIVIEPDGSGVALLRLPDSRLARAATSAGGLLGPALLAAVFFSLTKRARRARTGLLAFGGISLLSAFLVVRSVFGWLFVGALGASSLYVGSRSRASTAQAVLALLAVQLSLSVFSRADYLFTATTGAGPSDVAQIADALWLPFWFWGLVCGALSILVLAWGLVIFTRRS